MKQIDLLRNLKRLKKPYFTLRDFQKILGRDKNATAVTLNRYTKSGLIKKLATNIYVPALSEYDLEEIANTYYSPSYLSFESALAKYGILSEKPYILTLATPRRTKKIALGKTEVEYRNIKKELFYGFVRKNGLDIATPEKALLDQVYFSVFGKGELKTEKLSLERIDSQKLQALAEGFPKRVREKIAELAPLLGRPFVSVK